jgi:uncharacterized protein YrrD
MKLLELIGLPVYGIETGKRLTKVKDIRISNDWTITHIELEGRSRKGSPPPSVCWEEVTACGEDAIMIANDTAIRHTEAIHIERAFLTGNGALKDLPVMTSEGSQLGWVADVYFQPNMGNQVTGLEISDGLLSDLLEGRRRIDGTSRLKWGSDVIIFEDGG